MKSWLVPHSMQMANSRAGLMNEDQKWVMMGVAVIASGLYMIAFRRTIAATDKAISARLGYDVSDIYYKPVVTGILGLIGCAFGLAIVLAKC